MPAPALRELQRLFWHSLADEPGGASIRAELAEIVAPSATLDRRARLQVYADAYFWRLRDVLREDFPKVAALLGADQFEQLAREYLRARPSEHPSTRYVGRALADFLTARRGLSPFLSDLARLEWARVEVFDAPNAGTIGADALREVPADRWAELRFVQIPALEVVQALWPVHRIWAGEAVSEQSPERTTILVWRSPGDDVLHTAMDDRTAHALRLLRNGECFAAICGAFADLAPEAAAHEAAAQLARWLADGIIARAE